MWRLILIAACIAMAYLAGYAVACWLWPFAFCWRCKGDGKRRSPSGRAFRLCRWCRGTGRRRRVGRMIYAYFKHTRDKAAP